MIFSIVYSTGAVNIDLLVPQGIAVVQMSNTRVPLEPKFIDKVHWEQLDSYTLDYW